MISSGRAVVGSDGLLRSVHSRPPMTIRQVLSDDPGRCALCLVGSAAGPLAGDDVRFGRDPRHGPHGRAGERTAERTTR